MTTYNYTNCIGEKLKMRLGKTSYRNNGTLAIVMLQVLDNGEEEDYGMLTVNISDSDILANDTQAFIDTNNMGKDIVQWLVDNKIVKRTPFVGFSGFCTYPLVAFTKKALDGMVVLK